MAEALAGARVEEDARQTEHRRARARGLSRRGRLWLLGILAVGTVVRLVVAFESFGVDFDMRSLYIVRDALENDPLETYSLTNTDELRRWPYGPGFLPFIAVTDWLAQVTGTPFHGWVQVPQILADAALAWVVQHYLGLRGAGERLRLAAAALVALGPSFAVVSGFHGQIDAVAILPAAVALVVWERAAPGLRRALIAGALIGLAIAIKTSPALVLFALLPSARSWRERLGLVAAAAVVPLLAIAPWLIADGEATRQALTDHRALPGIGGVSLVAQPELAKFWLENARVDVSSLSTWLLDHQGAITAVLIAPFIALVWVRRIAPAPAAALLWLAFFVVAPGFTFQYVVWGLPFALMAGYVWQVAALQISLLIPTALIYWHADLGAYTRPYVALMIAIWIVLLAVLVRMTLRAAKDDGGGQAAAVEAPATAS